MGESSLQRGPAAPFRDQIMQGCRHGTFSRRSVSQYVRIPKSEEFPLVKAILEPINGATNGLIRLYLGLT